MSFALGVCLALFSTAFVHADNATQTPLTASQFEAYTTGKTLTYSRLGSEPYGAEEYLPGRRVQWAFEGDSCKMGQWYEEAGQICFVYEDNPAPQCWSFFLRDGGLVAQFENDAASAPLYEIAQSDEPLFCPGPQVGV